MNTQEGVIWVFNIIKNTEKINLKKLLKDPPFLRKESTQGLYNRMIWLHLYEYSLGKYLPVDSMWVMGGRGGPPSKGARTTVFG